MIKSLLTLSSILFVALCTAQPTSRTYGSYFGGSGYDYIRSTTIDDIGRYYIAGTTQSPDLPTNSQSFQMNIGSANYLDGYIACFNADHSLAWCTYIGGSLDEQITKIVWKDGHLYFAGSTISSDLPTTPGSYQPNNPGEGSIIIGKMNGLGEMQWLTHYGAYGYTTMNDMIVVDNRIIIVGYTNVVTPGFATADAFQTVKDNQIDGCIVEFSTDGERQYCSYFGGNRGDDIKRIIADDNNNIYICATTASTNLPLTSGSIEETSTPFSDIVVAKFNEDYTLEWMTAYGGEGSENPSSMIISLETNNIWIVGSTTSLDLPLVSNPLWEQQQPFLFSGLILEMSPQGTHVWSSYIASSSDLTILDVAMIEGNIYAAGHTATSNLPISTNAFQPVMSGGSDNFILSINASRQIEYCSFYGGNANEGNISLNFVDNRLLVTGSTLSTNNMSTSNAYDDSHNGLSDIYISIFDYITHLEEINADTQHLILYPNPSNDYVNIECASPIISYSLTDAQGQRVHSDTSQLRNGQLDVRGLASGVYVLLVQTTSGVMAKKLVIN